MNILFFYDKGVLPEVGGIARITHNLVSLFRRKGHNVWIVSINKLKEADYDKEQYFLPEKNLGSSDNQNYLVKFINDHHIEILINQCGMSPLVTLQFLPNIKSITGVKYLSCIHNSTMTPARNFAYQKEYTLRSKRLGFLMPVLNSRIARVFYEKFYIKKYKQQYRALLDICDRVVLLSDALKQEFLDVTALSASDKICAIPNVNTSALITKDVRKENVALWVGNAEFSVKRLDSMIYLWEKISAKNTNWKLYVLGDGANLDEAKEIVTHRKIKNITFTGRVDPLPYYEKAKYLFMTSSHEAFPMVLLEAFSNRIVPIVYNTFPTASLLIEDNKNGVLLKPYALRQAAKRVIELFSTPSIYDSMSNNGLSVLSMYSEENVYNLWINMITQL